ncbi:MAG: hypothetical protein JJU28_10380 [Cyclobacteriaceae bacterium]|nr:hypothetical protein [Cyclobacteriaceae bacterium]
MRYLIHVWCLIPIMMLAGCSQGDKDSTKQAAQTEGFVKDKNTVLLWLFDEEAYPNATITDASVYEIADLWLTSAQLTKGKYGNALVSTDGLNVMYAAYPGQGSLKPRQPDGEPTGLWGPTYTPENLLQALANSELTIEFWLDVAKVPQETACIVDMGRGFEPGFSIFISDRGKKLTVSNPYRALKTEFDLPDALYNTAGFVHLAISTNDKGKGWLFFNGKQTSPAISSETEKVSIPPIESPRENFEDGRGWPELSVEQRKMKRFNVALLQDRKAKQKLSGALDELRISDLIRFGKEGFVPGTYSRNHSAFAWKKPTPTGPPLLLSTEVLHNYDPIENPLLFGKRKHLFVDDKILEAGSIQNAGVVIKPVSIEKAEKTNIEKVNGEWRITFAQDGERKMGIATANYNSSLGLVYYYETQDGIHFEGKPVNMVNYPMGGDLFIDNSPEALENGTRFKMTAYVSARGIYMYTSPDALHWQRNETSVLPLLSGGSAESFYDDQQGHYVTYLKRDASFDNPEAINPGKRVSVRFETRDPYRVWPFKKMAEPYFEYSPFPVVTGEGDTQFILPHGAPGYEQVYRTRVIKYPFAPDTYLSFPWIYQSNSDDRNVAIAHSRDGNDWHIITDPYFVDKGKAREVISCQGLHRHGDELWQYLEFGGAHGRGEREWYRVRIRLDGFFALKSDGPGGKVTTKTLITDGDKLQVNYIAAGGGSLSVEILDEKGSVIPGFSEEDCKPLKGDDIAGEVQWRNARFDSLKGKKIKLRFAMNNTEIYAFEIL